MMLKHTTLALFAAASAILAPRIAAQSTIEQLMALVAARKPAPARDFYARAFKPDTVFRGQKLTVWLRQLTDADTANTSKPAARVFLDMGARAVPFLIRAQTAHADWTFVDTQCQPVFLCRRMAIPATAPLVAIFDSQQAIYAWMALGGIIIDCSKFEGKAPTKKRLKEMAGDLQQVCKALVPALKSSDPATNLAALTLVHQVATTGVGNGTFESFPVLLRKLMKHGAHAFVREAACDLLVAFGVRKISGGLTASELRALSKDTSVPPEVRRAVALGVRWYEQQELTARPGTPKPGR